MPIRAKTMSYLIGLVLCVPLTLAGCQITVGPLTVGAAPTPTLPNGWTWYHDSVYLFDVPVPPGWRANGYWNEMRVGDRCQRKVDLVPPISQRVYMPAPDRQGPELVSIVIPVTCPDFIPAVDNRHLAPAGTTKIDGATASLFTQIDEAGDQRVAIARFGGRQFVFSYYLEYGPSTPTQADDSAQIALYNTILQDFTYRGK